MLVIKQKFRMKPAFFITIMFALALSACDKSAPYTPNAGEWQLSKKYLNIAGGNWVLTPSSDSSVLLALDSNGTYVSRLNNKVVSQGAYSITRDTSFLNEQVLQLNNFNTTGIFNLFTLEEIGTNGQVLSVFDGLFMNISSDTLTLSSPPTPGGFI